jgi:dihydrolipoamide dehydrogenase
MNTKYDVIVIGAGPAGYVAAIRCAQLGLRTACVDEWENHQGEASLGGTCLNVGCIPSKALLESSWLFAQANNGLAQHGIRVAPAQLDLAAMMQRKQNIVADLTGGIQGLFKTSKVDLIHGHARLSPGKRVKVKSRASNKTVATLEAENIIIATGSSTVKLERAKLKSGIIVDSAGALEFDSVPERLGIIGAGVIGLELGSVWSRLGSKVMLLEAMDSFLPVVDKQIAQAALRGFKKQQLDIHLGARLLASKIKNNAVEVEFETESGQHKQVFDKLIVAVGRKPNSDMLFGDDMELELDERRFILVNKYCETSVPGIYAIGDVVRGPMLAHKGSEEGLMVAEHIAGHHASMDYDCIPSVIYTHPEIAFVGKTSQECAAQNIPVKAGVFPMSASGRARAMDEKEGMVKIIAHAESDRVLGVHIYSAQASELIAQAVTAINMQASVEDIILTVFAHPTLAESIHEAALNAHGRAIHIKNQATSH